MQFHAATNHTPASVRRRGGRGLDWGNRPRPFKEYVDLATIPLPPPDVAAEEQPLTVEALSHLLYYSAGVTRIRRFNGEEFHFRAYASAGALYPIEVYVVAGKLGGLAAGVYHYHPGAHALRLLRAGGHRASLAAAAAGAGAVALAPATVVLSGLYWRTTWKYEERGYRHLYWDGGMVLANLLSVAASRAIGAEVLLGFVDTAVDRILGLDGRQEVSLVLIPLGSGLAVNTQPEALPELHLNVATLSARPIDYKAIRAAHATGILEQASSVEAWRAAAARSPATKNLERGALPATPLEPPLATTDAVEQVIRRRGSTRFFTREAVAWSALSTILRATVAPLAADFRPRDASLNELYVIVNAVEGLAPGAYVLEPPAGLRQLKTGDFRAAAGFLCLEQPLTADAAAVVFLMADLESATSRLGPRGYRAAQLEAGILGGRMYLSAYAQRLGATGLTFYDPEVTRFFSPDAAGLDPMLAIAVGHDARRFRTATLTAKA